jgi:hypothetical protein
MLRREARLRSWIPWTALAVLFLGLAKPAPGQQTAIIGPPGRPSFRPGDSLFRVSLKEGRLSLVKSRGRPSDVETEIQLVLPPSPRLRDEGAIDAAIEIVFAKNPTLSASLSLAGSRHAAAGSEAGPVPGELYLKIRKPASVNGRRRDIPADAFAARPMRGVSYPQFQPGGKH